MFGRRIDPEPQTMAGKKVGTPCDRSLMVINDYAGPVVSGGNVVDSCVMGVVEAKVYTGAVGAALLRNPDMPWE